MGEDWNREKMALVKAHIGAGARRAKGSSKELKSKEMRGKESPSWVRNLLRPSAMFSKSMDARIGYKERRLGVCWQSACSFEVAISVGAYTDFWRAYSRAPPPQQRAEANALKPQRTYVLDSQPAPSSKPGNK